MRDASQGLWTISFGAPLPVLYRKLFTFENIKVNPMTEGVDHGKVDFNVQ
jgi:hypothetical protein